MHIAAQRGYFMFDSRLRRVEWPTFLVGNAAGCRGFVFFLMMRQSSLFPDS